eukprot:11180816-Lingulodinium_polyedra.AAC.1
MAVQGLLMAAQRPFNGRAMAAQCHVYWPFSGQRDSIGSVSQSIQAVVFVCRGVEQARAQCNAVRHSAE